jgi:hypothetical protein
MCHLCFNLFLQILTANDFFYYSTAYVKSSKIDEKSLGNAEAL